MRKENVIFQLRSDEGIKEGRYKVESGGRGKEEGRYVARAEMR
jgi:hypothetical protein